MAPEHKGSFIDDLRAVDMPAFVRCAWGMVGISVSVKQFSFRKK
jgi:hypothetical protein